MVINVIQDVFSLLESCNQEKTWYLLLNIYRFTQYYVQLYIKSLKQGS